MSYLVLHPLSSSRDKIVCCGCMVKEGNMFDLQNWDLEHAFNELTGLQMTGVRLCFICLQLLRKYYKFRIRCLNTNYIMRQISDMNYEEVFSVDEAGSQPYLARSNICLVNCEPTQQIKELTRTETEIISLDPVSNIQHPNVLEDTGNLTDYPELNLLENDDLHHAALNTYKNEYDNNIDFEWPTDEKKEFIIKEDINIKIEEDITVIDDDIYRTNDEVQISKKDDNNDFEWPTDDQKEELEAKYDINTNKVDFTINDEDNYRTNEKNKQDDGDFEWPVDEKEDPEIENDMNVVKKTNVQNNKKDFSCQKGKSKEQSLINNIAHAYLDICRHAKHYKQDLFIVLERMYELSLIKDPNEIITNGLCRQEKLERELFLKFFDLHKKISEIYNIDIQFRSLVKQRDEMNEKRRTNSEDKRKIVKCNQCCQKYKSPKTCESHVALSHNEEYPFECEICLYRFKLQTFLRQHLLRKHVISTKCRECNVGIPNGWNFARQHRDLHRGVTVICSVCGEDFTNKSLLQTHMRNKHVTQIEGAVDCLLCGDTYNGKLGLRMHLYRIHSQAARCADCGGLFRTAEALRAHVENVCAPGNSSCPICGDNFPSQELMRQHYDEQHKEEFKCEKCNKSLSGLIAYKRHVKDCLLPTRRVQRKVRYREKMKGVRSKEREEGSKYIYDLKLMCEVCGMGNFKTYAKLHGHQCLHTGERPYSCDVCHKTFREKQFVKKHMATHMDERRHKCPICSKAFKQMSHCATHLLKHMATHMDERRHKCPICSKAFKQMSHCATHLLTHTKERPFACKPCNKRFTGLTALKDHINTKHKGLPCRNWMNKHKNSKVGGERLKVGGRWIEIGAKNLTKMNNCEAKVEYNTAKVIKIINKKKTTT